MATIKDVGRLAGVSVATASRVISNADYPVREETRQRVREAAKTLNYHPNALAISLQKNESKTIGILVHRVVDAYLHTIAMAVAEVAQDAGYLPFICNTGLSREDEKRFAMELLSHQVAGIVIVGGGHFGHEEHLDGILRRGTPLVCVGRRNLMAPIVEPDEAGGMHQAIDHLIQLGHRKIGLIAGLPDFHAARERKRGYQEALHENGIEIRKDCIFQGDFTIQSGQHVGSIFVGLEDRPSAIVAANDLMAVGFCQELQKRGIPIPKQVSVVGFTDVPIAEYVNPPLTSVRIPKEELGREAARILLRMIDKNFEGIANKVVPTQLVLRASVSSPFFGPLGS